MVQVESREVRVQCHLKIGQIGHMRQNMLAPNPTFAHTQRTHSNNIVYVSSEEEWKHWLYAGILTVVLWDLGF